MMEVGIGVSLVLKEMTGFDKKQSICLRTNQIAGPENYLPRD